MYKDIYVIFDFKNKEIMIEIKDKNKKTYKITKRMNVTRIDDYNVMETIELPISKVSESPQGIVSQESKWVFSWNCWNNKQQFLKLEQYVPFPVCDKIFHPEHYDPWYTLACWSYIPEPTYGTTQTNDIIYEKKTNFHNKYKLTMEIKGSKYDWIATNNYRHPDPLQI